MIVSLLHHQGRYRSVGILVHPHREDTARAPTPQATQPSINHLLTLPFPLSYSLNFVTKSNSLLIRTVDPSGGTRSSSPLHLWSLCQFHVRGSCPLPCPTSRGPSRGLPAPRRGHRRARWGPSASTGLPARPRPGPIWADGTLPFHLAHCQRRDLHILPS